LNIVVFGAAGGTGRILVNQALAEGHVVTAFVHKSKLDLVHTNLKFVQGDVTDSSAVRSALANQNAAFSTLGPPTLRKADPARVRGVCDIVHTMEQNGPRRLVYLSSLWVGESCNQLGNFLRNFVGPLVLSKVVADHEAIENSIKKSQLDWTIVRPPILTHGTATGVYRHGCNIQAGSSFIQRRSRERTWPILCSIS
jgi:uncharacterized protein YbjT (DUF2867 family)